MAQTRIEMAAVIDGGTPVVFNGVLYTNSADLPTQDEINNLYSGANPGPQGIPGLSAYEVAVDNGFVGDEAAWLASLVGEAGGGTVTSVNSDSGPAVVLDADDISDTTTTHKFVTGADLTKLSNLSGTNTGDQDISGKANTADVVPNTRTVNGHALSGNVTVSKSDVGLGNVPNTDATNASNLASGTIPDARFPATLPAISGANLTNLPTATGSVDIQKFTASGTWTKPSGTSFAFIQVWGAGGGGSSGTRGTTSTNDARGGGGGGGGGYRELLIDITKLSATETVTIGAGGAGGAGRSPADGVQNAGGTGGNTTFGSKLTGIGGIGGGTSGGAAGDGGGATSINTLSTVGGAKGAPIGSSGEYGGAGGGRGATPPSNTPGAGGASVRGGAGGGGGGAVDSSASVTTGGEGGTPSNPVSTGGGVTSTAKAFEGGKAGDGKVGGTANNGAAGGIAGGGGGGGGLQAASGNSGTGGDGGSGLCVVTSF